MEEKKIDEKESIELILQMIQSTKEYIGIGNGNHFLYWGYFTAILAVVIQSIYELTGWRQCGWLWMLMFVFWIFMSIIGKRKCNPVMTYTNKVINHVWYAIGTMFLVTFAVIFTLGIIYNNYKSLDLMMPLSSLYVGIGVSTTGIIIQDKVTAYLPLTGIGIGLYLLAALYQGLSLEIPANLLFGLSFVLIMIIPGHVLNKKENKEC
ncbi:hypothetical protein [Xylanibacter oryzae]|uniref:hypothetical protein n=1 Tax=Xylanibacter oryzae TaxID=185293 RepID=UPI0004B7968D|nr:hypothetical protein [Xylanibacter oryzae]